MDIQTLDYLIIFGFFAIVLFIGIYVSKKSGKSSSEYFLSGRTMPWWLLGLSMVATTFSTDTPIWSPIWFEPMGFLETGAGGVFYLLEC